MTPEALRREAARRRLHRFTEHTFPGHYRTNFHHLRICEALEAVARYDLPRLIIVAPPRHGKSELVSRRFPAWYLGNNPHRQIIAATYGQDLSDRMSRDVKRIREAPEYTELYPEAAYGEMNKVSEWNLAQGGTYKGVGAGGPVTGFGANILLIDDPHKNREEAESPTIREKVWNWFTNDVMTRLEAPNAVVVMCTRWHEDDLVGRILTSPTADEWVILRLPRIQDTEPTKADPRAPGAPLWPGRLMLPWERCEDIENWPAQSAEIVEKLEADAPELDEDGEFAVEFEAPEARTFDPEEFAGGDPFFEDSDEIPEEDKKPIDISDLVVRDVKHYESFEKNDPYGAAALEQGDPTPKGGTIVDGDSINVYMADPAVRAMHSEALIISVDANFKKTKTSDFASAAVFGRTTKPHAIYLIDEAHGRYSYPQLKRAVKNLAARYPRASLLIEAKANGQALIDELRADGFTRVISFEPAKYGSKENRAQIAAEYISGGGLFVPVAQKAPFVNAWLEEVTKYGVAANDDRMDSLSQLVIHWAGRQSGLEHLRRIVEITG